MTRDILPSTATRDNEDEETRRLKEMYPAGIMDIMLYRHGYIPLLTPKNHQASERAVETLHPNNKYYPMVETAKRNKILYDERERQRNLARVNDIHPRPEWKPPQPVTALPRVNGPGYIRKFNNLLRPRFVNRGLR